MATRPELGERGSSLSAGQRQRIGLARAVFGNPFFVVLDEPNANLDHDGEVALIKAIQVLRQNQSIVVMVSHRPEALVALNFAMVLREGRIASFGLRDELLAQVARSAKMTTADKFKPGTTPMQAARTAGGALS